MNTPIALAAWADHHGVSPAALRDLSHLLGALAAPPIAVTDAPTNEAQVQALVRLEAARKGVRLFRNNCGAMTDDTGRLIRYGLANDSKAINEKLKSADLIGWRPVTITVGMIGTTIAQFVSRECKAPGWTLRGGAREQAQATWATLVAADGGDAKFCTGEGSL